MDYSLYNTVLHIKVIDYNMYYLSTIIGVVCGPGFWGPWS